MNGKKPYKMYGSQSRFLNECRTKCTEVIVYYTKIKSVYYTKKYL